MFFATPHYGLDKFDWERLVSHVVTCHGPEGSKAPTNGMVEEIRANCHVLTNVSEDFESLLKLKVFGTVNFLEENMTELLGDVVSCRNFVLLSLSVQILLSLMRGRNM
jgi:hypothetical protein